jgi:hypothetical protein
MADLQEHELNPRLRANNRRFWVFGFLVLLAASAFAAEPAGGALDVTLRRKPSGEPVARVYLALVPMDQPASRPTIEAIGDGGIKWRDIPPGQYALLAEAASFDPVFRRVDMVAGRSEEVRLDLERQFDLTGTVVDASGRPIADASVCHSRVATGPLMNTMSALAQRHASEHLCAKTDANGWWKLAVPVAKPTDLLVEAAGHEPVWIKREPATDEMPAITLRKGASLRVQTNRAAPEMILALMPSARIESTIPAWAQKTIWARRAATTAVEWPSLPAGDYDIVAMWPDPRRFSAPATLQRVTVGTNGSGGIRLSLPDDPPLRTKSPRIFVNSKTEIGGLRAFRRTDAKEVAAAADLTPRGRILYADADAGPEDVFFTTDADVILTLQRGQAQGAAVEGTKFPKAEGKLRVSVSEGATLPSRGNATFHQCVKEARFVLPVNVAKNGDVSLPLPVGCTALTLRFDTFSPLALATTARPREEVSLGTHILKAPASAEVHVVQQPGGTDVAEAIVTVFVERVPGEPMEVVKRIAGADGRVVIDGLPAGEQITFRAEQSSTKAAATVTRVIEPGQSAAVDVPLPAPVELTVAPRLAEDFKSANLNVEIAGVVVLVPGDDSERRSFELHDDEREAVFEGLEPGSWQILAMVRMGSVTQPVDVATITLEPGDQKKIEPVIRPLVVSGRVTSRGYGVKTSLEFTDPPGPGAISRRIFSKEDGHFQTVLPRPGLYSVSARRELNDPDIQLAPIRLDESSSRDVQIALPEGAIAVRVVSGDSNSTPVADAELTAAMLIDAPERGFARLERKQRTNTRGESLLDELQEGTWLVTAQGKDGNVAEKTVVVSKDRAAAVTLNLDRSVVEGVLVDGAGAPAASAAVDCIYSGAGNIPRFVRAETDSRGQFSLAVAKPAPARLQCGVTTADGAIGTFIAAPAGNVRVALPPGTSVLTITNWSDRGNRDRFWLVGPDGGLFDISWAARKLRRFDGPLTIPRLPAGTWSVVRVDSPAAFDALARGGAEALPRVARIRVSPGQSHELDMQKNDNSAPRTER